VKWYWPELTSPEDSEKAARGGAGVCFLVAGVTAMAAGASAWLGRPVLGMHAGAFVDAGIFAIAGWRIWRLSRTWAVLALAIFILETAYAVESSPAIPAAGAYLRVILALVLTGSVRGTFAFHSFKKKESAASLAAGAAGNR
jgi:hypothetical protein